MWNQQNRGKKNENHNTNNYDFQVDNNVNTDPYTMFFHVSI